LLTGISTRKSNHSRIHEVDFEHLEFGKHISDHMLICDYADGRWGQPQILPFANLSISPSSLALHYGQTVFEGMKAFRMRDDKVSIFRIDRHYDRFARSLERMCMPAPPREVFVEGMRQLVRVDRDWVPRNNRGALYIRPFVYASEAKFGIKISDEYRFVIFTGPVPDLFAQPIKVKVETHYTRAARGGTGFVKCGGNYGGALFPTQLARREGYDQLLWTTANDHPTIEESGAMNVMFVIDEVLVTPPLSDSILDGVTRDSLLVLAADMGIKVVERPVSVDELETAFLSKKVSEVFGAGTAAVVAPIELVHINGIDFTLPKYSHDSVWSRLREKLEKIRSGREEDVYGWNWGIEN
jgi:branched-chain amino acid aminotransferase